jgi:peptidoglycan/LPS O-acetylase OafA/YrhL
VNAISVLEGAAAKLKAARVADAASINERGVAHEGRITALDGARGISILLVIYGHLVTSRYWDGSSITLHYRLADTLATLGVDIFFVISGFIITTLALRERETVGDFSASGFYIRRVLRIIPPYFSYLLCILVLSAFGAIAQSTPQTLMAAAFACNLPEANCGNFAGHSWSLAYEEQYYVCFPLLFLCVARSIRALLGALLIVLLGLPLVRYALNLGHVWFLIGHAAFSVSFICIGALTAVYAGRTRRLTASRYAPYASLIVACTLACLLWLDVFSHAHPDIPRLGKLRMLLVPTLEPVCVAWLVISSVYGKNWITRLLNSAPLQFLGMISYSLYLWQQAFTRSPDLVPGAPWLNFAPLMLVIAALSYYCIERPAIRLGKRIIASRHANSAPSIAVAP